MSGSQATLSGSDSSKSNFRDDLGQNAVLFKTTGPETATRNVYFQTRANLSHDHCKRTARDSPHHPQLVHAVRVEWRNSLLPAATAAMIS